MRQEINNLREIARCCAAGEAMDEMLSLWLASALQRFLSHSCTHLDEAFGLAAEQGGMPWWLEEAVRARNTALCQLADILRPARSVSALVHRIRVMTVRYGASAWRRDRYLDDVPPQYAGTPSEFLWRAFKSGAPMPLGERQLRTILGGR